MAHGYPQPWCPWLMPLSFLACIAVFIYTMYVNDCPEKTGAGNCVFYGQLGRFSFQPRSENLLYGPSIATLRELGGVNRNLVVDQGQNYRLFFSMWLHANVLHLFTNVMAILLMGIRMEEDYGFLRIGSLYLLAGIGANVLSCLRQGITETTISVGSSGALFGLLGASLSEIITNWTLYTNKCAALTTLMIVIGLNIAIGFIPGVDGTAHLGGFVAGFFLGFLLLLRPQYGNVEGYYIAPVYDLKHRKPKYQCHQQVLWVISLIILVLGYIIGFAMLYNGERVQIPIPTFIETKQIPNFGATQTNNMTRA